MVHFLKITISNQINKKILGSENNTGSAVSLLSRMRIVFIFIQCNKSKVPDMAFLSMIAVHLLDINFTSHLN
jgi:hypothetical protein